MPKPAPKNPDPEKLPPKIPGFPLRYIYIFVFVFLIFLIFFNQSRSILKETTLQEFEQTMLTQHDVEKIDIINSETVEIYIKKESIQKEQYHEIAPQKTGSEPKPGPHYFFNIGSIEVFENRLEKAQENFSDKDKIIVIYSKREDWWRNILSWIFPIALLILFWLFILRRVGSAMGGPGNAAFNFGKSRAEEYQKGKLSQVNFKQVAGYDEAKAEVMEIVEFLKQPEHFTKLGAKIPKGVLLVGPPGTGKTLMAKAVAGEAGVPFFSLSGSEFVEMFVGVGASRVRDLFEKAKQKAPSIIFIDEIDTVGRVRSRAVSLQANDERESTLNQLLAEMDGFDPNTGVIVLAATNRADILDPALLRPGRFDRHIYLELPNKKERDAIFNVHLKPLKLESSVDVNYLSSQTPGFSGADIANVCNEAALIAARRKKAAVDMQDFHDAIDRVVGGLEKKTKVISPQEKKIIAYHESGHAITSWMLKHVDPLVKVSIIPRGKSLGSAWYLPEERQIITKAQFDDRLSAALGGRAAEEIVFHEVSSGALDDLEKVTKQAYMMVANLGLSEKIGNISFYDSTGTRESAFQKPYSEATAQVIDDEARKLVDTAYERAKNVLIENRAKLDKLANLLLEKEVVHRQDIETILGKRPSAHHIPAT